MLPLSELSCRNQSPPNVGKVWMASGLQAPDNRRLFKEHASEPRSWIAILPRSKGRQLLYARAVKTLMCTTLHTFATERVTYIFAKKN